MSHRHGVRERGGTRQRWGVPELPTGAQAFALHCDALLRRRAPRHRRHQQLDARAAAVEIQRERLIRPDRRLRLETLEVAVHLGGVAKLIVDGEKAIAVICDFHVHFAFCRVLVTT